MDDDGECQKCRFFCRTREHGGECVRFPPTSLVFNDDVVSFYPSVDNSEWCGEYAKDPDAAEVLTEDVLAAAASPAGGYTKTQLSVIGVPWPPPKGWREKAVGSRHAAGTISMLMAFRVADGSASGPATS